MKIKKNKIVVESENVNNWFAKKNSKRGYISALFYLKIGQGLMKMLSTIAVTQNLDVKELLIGIR